MKRARLLHALEAEMAKVEYRESLRLNAQHKFNEFTELVGAGFTEDQAIKMLRA